MTTALITGITGQDGSYLTEFLLARGYEVHGIVRRASLFNTGRLDHLYRDPHASDTRLRLHYGDLSDAGSLRSILQSVRPAEVYNLAAQSHVRVSFDQPEYTADINALGVIRLIEAVREIVPKARVYQAASSEMFGASPPPQNEATAFRPRSPYACAKVHAFHEVVQARDAWGLFAVNGILFNHESPRRGETFVTRKITRAAGRIQLGLQETLFLGNLDARRDWGFAGDYVEAMWKMLQADAPRDYVIATGQSRTVREFLAAAFGRLGLEWQKHVKFDARYLRPAEVDALEGDSSEARRALGWAPRTDFNALVAMMVDHDLDLARREKTLIEAGYRVDAPREA